jgi:hypothetical protein
MRNVRRIVAIFLMSLPAVAQGPAARPASAQAAAPAVDPVTGDPVETLSGQQAKRRVEPGKYLVTLYAGAGILARTLEVRPEYPSGVKFVLPRK